ncbi:unnamed protein product, partial [Ceratitis capitata]
ICVLIKRNCPLNLGYQQVLSYSSAFVEADNRKIAMPKEICYSNLPIPSKQSKIRAQSNRTRDPL